MEFSRYVKVIEKESGDAVVFNTINSCIVELPADKFENGNLCVDRLSKSEIQYLSENLFFYSDDDAIRYFMSEINPKELHIIISVTELCNLRCAYCYENNAEIRGVMSFDILDRIKLYIEGVISMEPSISAIHFDLIGGEPLLAVDQIEHLVNIMHNICGKNVFYLLETNGTQFDNRVRKIFDSENIVVHIALSSKSDHDKWRPYGNGSGSFSTIVENLVSAKDFFSNPHHNLAIRYNTNHENIKYFDSFRKELHDALQYEFSIEIAYTVNYPYNSLKNTLPFAAYQSWNLEMHFKYENPNYQTELFIPTARRYHQCIAYDRYSIKIFSDGSLGLCNAWVPGNRRGHINHLLEGRKKEEIFSDLFKKYKVGPECINCGDLFLGGGKRFCRGNDQCLYSDFSIDQYLKAFCEGRRCMDESH